MTRTARKMARLIEALGIVERAPDDLEILRTHAGHHQRSDGAWSWTLWSPSRRDVSEIGSRWTATELLRMPIGELKNYTNDFGQTEIRPK